MKFKFKVQQYQTDAVEAVVRVFQGQPLRSAAEYMRDLGTQEYRYKRSGGKAKDYNANQVDFEADLDYAGFRNEEIFLTDDQILDNIHALQAENNIRLSDGLVAPFGRCALDVEMETGTGKTYVYIRTIFELNKRYGWSKFIVVVPSVAIREGVNKTFEMTADHFKAHYGKRAEFYIYDSAKLDQIEEFSKNCDISVIIINTQSFAAEDTVDAQGNSRLIIYQKRDDFGTRCPMDVIAANRPILILDEPQRLEGAGTRRGLKRFNPLFTLNYSATHKVQHNLVYVLDALDAYNKRLVKKIEVKGFEVINPLGTGTYIYVDDIIVSEKKPPKTKLEIEIGYKKGIKRECRNMDEGDSLYHASKEMEQYRDLSITNIDTRAGIVEFSNGLRLHKGETYGNIIEKNLRRAQIRETIKSHFEKEESLFAKGIKTLSLFFIDRVKHYRLYDYDGNALLGEYGKMFEEEYDAVRKEMSDGFSQEYRRYLELFSAHEVHNGYFSVDKKTGQCIDSHKEDEQDKPEDVSAYDLILKNKERLLSFDEPTRFIFSHSALREGWDNPNVFQICALKHDADNTNRRRQEVGRGMRLCVDKDGARMDADALGDGVQQLNKLTVIANESYGTFVAGLQQEIKDVLYDRPTKATKEYFFGKTVLAADGKVVKVNEKQAVAIYNYLAKNDYVNDDQEITQKYRDEARAGTLAAMPETLKSIEAGVHALVQAIYDDSMLAGMIEDGNKPKIPENPLNERFYKKEFQELWNAINHKYAYTVKFDSHELIEKAIKNIDEKLNVGVLHYRIAQAEERDEIDREMVHSGEAFGDVVERVERLHGTASNVKYDLIGKIAGGTRLTRRTVAAILKGITPETFAKYRQNPEEFISKTTQLINEQKATMIVEHIVYDTIEGKYDSSIFTAEKHTAMDRAYPAKKAVQKYVFTDGTADKSIERRFAESMDIAEEVYIYAKLPSGTKGFQIPTPVGDYSPDWAIVFHEGKVKHIYFVAETKGSMSSLDLRPIEKAKIDCAKKLFEKLSNGLVKYDQVDSFDELMNKVMK